MVATLTFAGPQAERLLAVGRGFLQRHWPVLLAWLALAAGLFVVVLGATGVAGRSHSHFGRLMRGIRNLIHP
jgi:hypothetical protein